MAKCGRLEGRITVPVGGWPATFTDSGGSTAVSITPGNYYPVDLISQIDSQLGANWTISASDGESSATGRCTIHSTATPWSLTWGSVNFRAALGFAGDISSVSVAQTGTNHMVGVWLPGCSKFSQYGDSANGSLITDFRSTKGPTGVVRAFIGNTHRQHDQLRWDGVTAARAMSHHESVSGESFESWYLDVCTGRKSYVPVCTYVRLYWDADVDGTYAVGRLLWSNRFDLKKVVETWTGAYIVELPSLVVEGS